MVNVVSAFARIAPREILSDADPPHVSAVDLDTVRWIVAGPAIHSLVTLVLPQPAVRPTILKLSVGAHLAEAPGVPTTAVVTRTDETMASASRAR